MIFKWLTKRASGKHKSSDFISIFKTFHGFLPLTIYKAFYHLSRSPMTFPVPFPSKSILHTCLKTQSFIYPSVLLSCFICSGHSLLDQPHSSPYTPTSESHTFLLLIVISPSSIFSNITSTRRSFLTP